MRQDIEITKRCHDRETDLMLEHLSPLRRGEMVYMYLEVPGRVGKEIGIHKYPVVIARAGDSRYVVSVIGRGSAMVDTNDKLSLAHLSIAGIPTRLSQTLLSQLTKLGETNGSRTTHPTHTGTRIRRRRRPRV